MEDEIGYQDSMMCPECTKNDERFMLDNSHVILYDKVFIGKGLKELIFDTSPFLEEQLTLLPGKPTAIMAVRLKREQGKDGNTYDYRVSCPICGEFTMEHRDVPEEADVYVGADRGEGFVILKWRPDSI